MVEKIKSRSGFSWLNPLHLLAFGFGLGKIPVMPGTFGSLLGIPAYLLLGDLLLWQYVTVVIVLFIFGIVICQTTSRDMGGHDHPGIVFDEVVGMLVSYIALPQGWGWLLAGFVLFRLFDIWKPFPIYIVDKKMKGGTGIMFDDVLAGLYALLSLQLINSLWFA